MKAKELIKYTIISKLLCGSKFTLRNNNVPDIHKSKVKDLERVVQKWIDKNIKN